MPYKYISQQAQVVRSYYSGFGKAGIIYPMAFLVALALGLVSLGIVFYMKQVFQSSALTIGLLLAEWSVCYVLGCIFIRPVFSRVLPRYLVMTATGAAFVLTLGMQWVHSVPAMFVLMGLYGAMISLFWPPLMGWLSTDVEGPELGRMVSGFNLSWCLGNIVSPMAAGTLSEVAVRLPLLAGTGIFLAATVFLAGAMVALPGARSDRAEADGGESGADVSGRSTLLRYPAWIGLFASFFGMGVISTVFPLSALQSFRESTIGALLMVRSLFNGACFIILGRTVFWHFSGSTMLLGQLLGAGAFILLTRAHSAVAIGGALGLIGVSMALSYSSSIFHGASGSANRARRMAIHESVLSAGVVGGSGIGALVYQARGAAWVYWLCAGILLLGLLIQAALCAWSAAREKRAC